jgi:hypothetical protein
MGLRLSIPIRTIRYVFMKSSSQAPAVASKATRVTLRGMPQKVSAGDERNRALRPDTAFVSAARRSAHRRYARAERPSPVSEITQLLQRINAGDPAARDSLFALLYQDLRKLARARLRNSETITLLDTTSLVHDRRTSAAPSTLNGSHPTPRTASIGVGAVPGGWARKRAFEFPIP